MTRAERIEAALARRGYASWLAARIMSVLDGRLDRARLPCCNSGCSVCNARLLEIVDEVAAAERGAGG